MLGLGKIRVPSSVTRTTDWGRSTVIVKSGVWQPMLGSGETSGSNDSSSCQMNSDDLKSAKVLEESGAISVPKIVLSFPYQEDSILFRSCSFTMLSVKQKSEEPWTHHGLHLADPGDHHVLAGDAARPGHLLPVLLADEGQCLWCGRGDALPQRFSDTVGQVPVPSE